MSKKPNLRGLRFQRLNYSFSTPEPRVVIFLKKSGYQHNRYHKSINNNKKITPLFKYSQPFLKGWIYCTDLIQSSRKYFSVLKSTLGVTYVAPLIDSVNLGDRIRLYRNATRFYYFIKSGSVVPLKFLRTGFMLCQIGFIKPILALAAGTYIVLNTFNQTGVQITLPSGKLITVSYNYYGFIGRNSGIFSYKQYLGKASCASNHLRRIIVRSCAKNPVDHPNGGRTRGKQLMKTPWGKVARSGK